MQIFIMRHGEASNQGISTTQADSLRPLTTQGELEVSKMGRWLARHHKGKLHVMVSPYLRAQQTCEHVLAAYNKEVNASIEQKTLDMITPMGDVEQVHDFIDGFLVDQDDDNSAILLISHMPFVSYLLAKITKSQHLPLFATGAIALLEYQPRAMQGELINLVYPESITD